MQTDKIIRLVLYYTFTGILCYLAVGYSYELYQSGIPVVGSSDASLFLDGEDVTPLVTLCRYGLDSMFSLISAIAYGLLIAIISAVLFVPFGLIGFNRKRNASLKEYRIYKNSLIIILLSSLVISLVLTRFSGLAIIIIYNGIWALFELLFVVLPAKKLSDSQ